MDPRFEGSEGWDHDAGAPSIGDTQLCPRMGTFSRLEGSRDRLPGRTKGFGSCRRLRGCSRGEGKRGREQDAEQLKYYAPGVGNVQTGWAGAGAKVMEALQLMRVEQLSAKALADAQAKAVQLEQSAYKHSKDLYAKTPAMTVGTR